MPTLTQSQIDQFWRDGVLTVPGAVSPGLLARLQGDFSGWIEESRQRSEAWGDTLDGRARFDLQPGHSAQRPALRRVQAPSEVSAAYHEAMRASRMTEMVADLIGPNVKHHHNKINSKLPGAGTEVKWHQDFLFTPHTNDDIVTALLMVDDVTPENGPLEVAPGTHRGALESLWHEGAFTGAVSESATARFQAAAVRCLGPAGSVCLMHTRLAHGSAPNRSQRPRTLYICVYSAADAVPCSPNPVPNSHEGLIVAGTDPGTVRCVEYAMQRPEYPKNVSFFSQQSHTERT